jgi:DNA (cytosine-5)-methyltransferase 1
MGYKRAGFEITGVDIEPQSGYPGAFVLSDALEYVARHGHEYDVIHGSPPCQAYCPHVTSQSSPWVQTLGKDEPALIEATRAALLATGKPWIMENVMGSRRDIQASVMLCGTMFGLPISRHRLFESSHWIAQPEHPRCTGVAKRFAATKGWEYRDMSVTGKGRRAGTKERWKEIMGMDWTLTQHQLSEAIPPAYTEYLGRQLMRVLP